MDEQKKGIGRGELIALIVSSCIGTGIFGITSDVAAAATPRPRNCLLVSNSIILTAFCGPEVPLHEWPAEVWPDRDTRRLRNRYSAPR